MRSRRRVLTLATFVRRRLTKWYPPGSMTVDNTTHNCWLKAALDYAAQGWHVIPLEPGGKRPLFDLLPRTADNTPTYKLLAETAATPEEIARWWQEQPDANVGVLTSASGLLIVDLDPYNMRRWGAEALGLQENASEGALDHARKQHQQTLREREGFETTGLVVKSANSGWHLYYVHPQAPVTAVSQTQHNRGPGIDVKSGTGYVVAPPSRLSGNRRYKWVEQGTPGPCPTWCIAHSETNEGGPRVYSTEIGWVSRVLRENIPEGGDPSRNVRGRNVTIRALALRAARLSEPEDQTIANLQNFNLARCRPPLPMGDVIRQVAFMYARHREEAGDSGEDRVSLRLTAAKFPVELLAPFPTLSRWIHGISGASKAVLDYCAFAALMGLGVAATGRYTIETINPRGHEWSCPTNLWGMAVLDSGYMKSPPFKAIADALRPTEEWLSKIASKYNAEVITQREVLAAAKQACKAALTAGSQPLVARELLALINLDLQNLPPVLHPYWNASDATPEAFNDAAASLGWLVAMSDEGREVLSRFFGHYGGKSNISAMLKFWEGGSGVTHRIGRGTRAFADVHAGLFVATQPSVLGELGETEAVDRGWTARCLFCIPQDPRSFADDSLTSELPAIKEAYAQLLRSIFFGGRRKALDAQQYADTYKPDVEHIPRLAPPPPEKAPGSGRKRKPLTLPSRLILRSPNLREKCVLHCHSGAFALVEEFRTELLEETLEGGHMHPISGAGRKAHDNALRIAALLMLAETEGEGREIEEKHTLIGVAMMRRYFLRAHYVAADMMAQPPEASIAIHLLRRFRSQSVEEFTLFDVERELTCRSDVAKKLMCWLESRGAITLKKKGRKYTGTVLPGVTY